MACEPNNSRPHFPCGDHHMIRLAYVPFQESWQNDLQRLSASITDYRLIGTIVLQALRQLQSYRSSPSRPFRSMWYGYEIDAGHNVLAAGERE
jgi:hypothetical protein